MERRRRYDRVEPYRPPEPSPQPAGPVTSRSHARPETAAGQDAVAPVDVDGVLATTVGTLVWALAFIALLPFRDRLEDNDADWWLWTCAAGAGLGLFGIQYCRRRRERLTRSAGGTPQISS